MRLLRNVSLALALCVSSAAFAAEFDGTVALECTATKGHDCLPTENKCNRLQPEGDAPPVFGVDIPNKTFARPSERRCCRSWRPRSPMIR